MVWSPVWLKVLQTIVWLPFKSHAQSSFDKSVLLSNPHSKMVGFCFGLAMPTLVWYTTLVVSYEHMRPLYSRARRTKQIELTIYMGTLLVIMISYTKNQQIRF